MAVCNQVEAGLKLCAVREYLEEAKRLYKVAGMYDVSRSTLQKWLLNYKIFGEKELQHRT